METPLSTQTVETININGLVPVIINIAPVNVPLIFGAVNVNGDEPLADTNADYSLDSARNEYYDRMIEDEELAAI